MKISQVNMFYAMKGSQWATLDVKLKKNYISCLYFMFLLLKLKWQYERKANLRRTTIVPITEFCAITAMAPGPKIFNIS